MTGTYRTDEPAMSEKEVHVVVHTLGFDGAHRVISMLRQRGYSVHSFSAHAVEEAEAWTVICTVRLDRRGDVLLARLHRLPSVIDAWCSQTCNPR